MLFRGGHMDYLYIFGTILFTVYGQLVLKWQISQAGSLPMALVDKIIFLLRQFGNLWILSGFAAAVVAALCWMAAMTTFELSYAYPFMSLSFILVLVFSAVFLHEAVTVSKALGILLIVAGLVVGSFR